MARACTEMVRHKEALEHSKLSEFLSSILQGHDSCYNSNPIDVAKQGAMKHLAKLTEDTIATAEKDWKLLLEKQDKDFQEAADRRTRPLNFEHFILDGFILQFCIMYRVLHYVVAYDDLHYLDLTTSALKKVDTEHDNSAEVKYLFATVLFGKNRKDVGIQSWYKVASLSKGSFNKWNKSPRIRPLVNLVALCLDDADIPFRKRTPLVLDENTELGDVCLVLSSWLRDHGNTMNTRHALRCCVKEFESDGPSKFSSICDPKNEFYCTDPLLRPSERVPEGMVPLISSNGKNGLSG
ncbi:hypothetical protein ETB97_010344 [Aspergillus alliaceus]|uniref:Uncharacterized protein n=1 Tax=Petromyces alliaceus TaxID=209559 RepID=A0A8H6E0D4_PETAA|nr:hypothetical protein ETB97_010344 [Aspergillus burnettii]